MIEQRDGVQIQVLYSERAYQNADAFIRHPDFAVFKQQYTVLIDGITQFFEQHAEQVTPAIPASRIATVNAAFATLKDHLFNIEQNFFSRHRDLVYGLGKEYFQKISQLLHDERIPVQHRLDAITNLAEGMTVCGGRIMTELQNGIGALQSRSSGISGLAARWKRRITEQLALEHAQRYHPPPGEEVHFANAFLNYSADRLGIPQRPDPFVRMAESVIALASLNEFDQTVRTQLRPIDFATDAAQDYLHQVQETTGTAIEQNIPTNDTGAAFHRVSDMQAAVLTPEFGAIPVSDFMFETDDGNYAIARRPTLIASRMMEGLQDAGVADCAPVTLASAAAAGGELVYLDGLLWLRDHDEHRPLSARHLGSISPHNLFHAISGNEHISSEACGTIFCQIAEVIVAECNEKNRQMLHPGWLSSFAEVVEKLSGVEQLILLNYLLELSMKLDDPSGLHALLEAGFDVESMVNSSGDYLLHAVVQTNRPCLLEAVLASGADIEETSNRGETALVIAARLGCTEVLTVLLARGANIEACSPIGDTPLIAAARHGQTESIKKLIEGSADKNATLPGGETALMVASQLNELASIEVLLQAGLDKNACDYDGFNALLYAAQSGHTEVVELLLNAGVDTRCKVNYGVHAGCEALILAAQYGHTDLVRVLIKAGVGIAEPSVTYGKTALMLARENGHDDIVQMLS